MKRHLLAVFLALTSVVAQGGTITLVSSEGDKYVLEEPAARLSGVIEFTLAMTTEDAEGEVIPCFNISSNCLQAIIKDLEHLHAWYKGQRLNPLSLYEHDENSALRAKMAERYVAETQSFYTDTEKILALLKAADFLHVPELIHQYARDIAKQSYENPIATFDSLHGNTYQAVEEVIVYYLKPHMHMGSILFSAVSPSGVVIAHDDRIVSVAFSSDGTKVVTGSWDRTARVSDARTGAQIAVITHGDKVVSVAFSSDGTLVVTGSCDGTVFMSDAQTGRNIAETTYADRDVSEAFRLFIGSYDRTARTAYFPFTGITDFNQLLAVLISRKISLDNIDEHVREKIQSILNTLTERQQAALRLLRGDTKNKWCNIL